MQSQQCPTESGVPFNEVAAVRVTESSGKVDELHGMQLRTLLYRAGAEVWNAARRFEQPFQRGQSKSGRS